MGGKWRISFDFNRQPPLAWAGASRAFIKTFNGLADGGAMSEFDDEFLLRPGAIGKARSDARTASFLGQVRHAALKASEAGPGPRRRSGPKAARIGRGVGRGALGTPGRRVVAKARIVRHAGARYRAAPLSRHIVYLEREGVTRDGGRAAMFDAQGENADVEAFATRCEDDRHHFRFIVSPEDASRMQDLRAFARDLMRQAEVDLGTQLDWVAIDHWNTDNPHLHILLRGRADDGRDLVIAGDYVAQGLRSRAERLVALELGPRSALEVAAAHDADVAAERWTRLDRKLRELASTDGVVVAAGAEASSEDRSRLLGRLARLQALGLAEPQSDGRWRLEADLEIRLRALAAHKDVIKTYHEAMTRNGQSPSPERLVRHDAQNREPVLGRLIDRGLRDELAGSAYLLVDGLDGRQHYLTAPALGDVADAPIGAVVEWGRRTGRDGLGRHTLRVLSDLGLEAQVNAEGATWLDRRIVQAAMGGGDPSQGGLGGFAGAVQASQADRLTVLAERGLAELSVQGVRLAPGLLATLRTRELEAEVARISGETGRPARVAAAGEPLVGVYQRRLDLASGRFVVLDDGLGFQLAPWRPALESRRGHALAGVMTPEGQARWTLGRERGPGL